MKLVLRRGRAKPLWHGHPWVYSQAVARTDGAGEPGDVADVVDDAGRFIGRGFWNPRSQIVCRLATWRDEPLGAPWLRARVGEAIELRARIGLPSEDTDAYRLINAEGDGLPGLIVDVYGGVAAVQFTALGLKRREREVHDALWDALRPRGIVEVGGASFAEAEGFAPTPGPIAGRGDVPPTVPCREDGIALEVDPLGGQKTGMFLDQRENRMRVGRLSRGARVLDVYSYTGGFGLQAGRGGAAAVRMVDASRKALDRALRHAELNRIPIETVEGDAFRYLETVEPGSFDLVVLDPPKFARARKDLDAAMKGYRRLNALGMRACADGALLATCSCSQLVSAEEFERTLAAAALDAKRRIRVLHVASQGPDHPVPPAFPEGRYLKFVLCEVRA